MLYNQKAYADSVHADRLTAAAQRRSRDLEGIVLAAADGDGAAWTSLVDRFAARIRTIARSHRLSAQDAEDVAQNTWLRLLEHIAAMRQPAAVGAWLTTTARRESLRTIEAGSRERPMDALPETDASEPVNWGRLAAAERRAAIADAVSALSERDRVLLGLLFAEPAPSYAEISARLDMPIGSIGPTRQRCMARLRGNPGLEPLAAAD